MFELKKLLQFITFIRAGSKHVVVSRGWRVKLRSHKAVLEYCAVEPVGDRNGMRH